MALCESCHSRETRNSKTFACDKCISKSNKLLNKQVKTGKKFLGSADPRNEKYRGR